MDNLKPKKQRTILEWFLYAVRSGRDQMTVPPHIIELSCGCKKEDEKCLTITQDSDGYWRHTGCKILKDLPKTDLHYRFQYWSNFKNKMVVVFEKK